MSKRVSVFQKNRLQHKWTLSEKNMMLQIRLLIKQPLLCNKFIISKTNPMRNTLKFIVIFLCFTTSLVAQNRYDYIEKYKNIAIREMERTGVPASIKLAQGILESNAGTSYLAKKANNHFGIKCGGSWKGRTEYREDDDYDENGQLEKSCFRAYKSAEESYIAHSEFLRNPRSEHRYGFLFRYNVTDYRRWAHGLKKAGYATSPTYAQKLINVVETYSLSQYDRLSSGDIRDIEYDDTDMIAGLDMRRINDVKVVYSERGDTPANIGTKANVNPKRILKYNEMLYDAATLLKRDELVFLQKKRRNFRGTKKWHYVREGETMYGISQLYGVRLKNLYHRNRMQDGTQPEQDERIKLRGWKVSKKDRPRLRPGYVEPPRKKKTETESDEVDGFMDNENSIEPDMPPITTQPNTSPNTNNSGNYNGDYNGTNNGNSTNNTGNSSNGNISSGTGSANTNNTNGNYNNSGYPNNTSGSNTSSGSGSTNSNGSTVVHPPIFNPNTSGSNSGSNNNPGNNSSGNSSTDSPYASYYVVIKGDTLYSLSRKYGASVSDLKRWNGLRDNLIYPGDRIRVQ